MSDLQLTIPDAIRKLFGVDVAKESPLLKTKANSLVRNKLIKTSTELKTHRNAVYIAEGQEVVLFNALVLNAFYSDPKDVKRIFDDENFRQQAALRIKSVLLDRQSLVGVGVSNSRSSALVKYLQGKENLFKDKLPNPFKTLPQLALGDDVSLLQALLSQAATLSAADGFLLSFINGDIAEAYRLSKGIESNAPEVQALIAFVEEKYKEAEDFDMLLDQFRSM